MRAAHHLAGAGLIVSLGATATAGGQMRATLDVGGASVRYADSVTVTATTVAPALRLDDGPLTALAFGSLSAMGSAGWSSQGAIALSALSRPFGATRFELAASGGGSLHQDGTRTGQYLGRARVHAGGESRGVWVGGAGGNTWDGAVWQRTLEGELGAWAQPGALTLLATVRPAAVGDSLRFTDFGALVRRDTRRLELSASAGMRNGVGIPRDAGRVWGSLSAAVWVAPPVGIVADAGSYPADYRQGFPGGRYFSIAIRVAPHRRAWEPMRPLASLDPTTRSRATGVPAARLEIASLTGGGRVVRVHAPGAHRIEIMADFTEWKPVELASAPDGWWNVVTRVTPGVHQVNVRVDGGPWGVPAGATAEVDEFGALVGVVIVR